MCFISYPLIMITGFLNRKNAKHFGNIFGGQCFFYFFFAMVFWFPILRLDMQLTTFCSKHVSLRASVLSFCCSV